MFFLRQKKLLNTGVFSEADYTVLNYEQLLEVNGAGGSGSGGGGGGGPSGPTGGSGSNLTDQGYPSSTDYNPGIPPSNGPYTGSNLTDQGYPSSTDPNPGTPPSSGPYTSGSGSCGGGGSNNSSYNSKIQTSVAYSKPGYVLVEGVGLVGETILQGCYTDGNNKLTVSSSGFFSGKDNASVDSYRFYGEITLIVNGQEVETKTITAPTGSYVYDGSFNMIGDVTFDTSIPTYGSVAIKSDIDMVVNHTSVNFASNTTTLR